MKTLICISMASYLTLQAITFNFLPISFLTGYLLYLLYYFWGISYDTD
jgi:hypothetical protein